MAKYEVLSNAQLLERYNAKQALKKESKQLEEQIRPAQMRMAAIEKALESVEEVTDVLKGVCLNVWRDGQRRWEKARTLGSDDKNVRRIELYQHVRTQGWCIRVNQGYAFQERFCGGRVLGLTNTLSYRQAVAIARRWLLGDETVLEAW